MDNFTIEKGSTKTKSTDDFTIEEGSFESTNRTNKVAYYIIAPKQKPIAVLQFCHGMAEHSRRYEEFGKFIASKGIAFCISDHIGHGKSINSDDDLGYFAKKNGWMNMVEDAAKLTGILKEKFDYIPFFIAGHSMGSFVVRSYISMHKGMANGSIIIGTGNATPQVAIGTFIARVISLFRGGHHRSKMLDNLSFGSYTKNIENARTTFDWLSCDEKNVDKYIADPLCGFLFTASGFKDVSKMMRFVSTKKWADSVKKDNPVLILSGEQDPVGKYGEDVKKVNQMLKESGVKSVTLKLYPEFRHEILNETNHSQVYEDISSWLTSKL